MSLHYYYYKEDVPEEIPFIEDNVKYFLSNTIKKLDKNVNWLLKGVDDCTYLNESFCVDRFGGQIHWADISTGGMTILNVYYNPEVCFDVLECGHNALENIFSLNRGQVGESAFPTFGEDVEICDIIYNGKRYTNVDELMHAVQ